MSEAPQKNTKKNRQLLERLKKRFIYIAWNGEARQFLHYYDRGALSDNKNLVESFVAERFNCELKDIITYRERFLPNPCYGKPSVVQPVLDIDEVKQLVDKGVLVMSGEVKADDPIDALMYLRGVKVKKVKYKKRFDLRKFAHGEFLINLGREEIITMAGSLVERMEAHNDDVLELINFVSQKLAGGINDKTTSSS
ncbi:hypothetical protein V6259_13015 [Marinomonas sp. TI.3.20]|uniref:hypothetical protein n=1 Tax=Marinomonas sp. TI.3.20 TaxID=3121296 RepID=UPI00311ECEE5